MKTYFVNASGNGYFRGLIVKCKDIERAKCAVKAYTRKDVPECCFKEIDLQQEVQEVFDWDDLSYKG